VFWAYVSVKGLAVVRCASLVKVRVCVCDQRCCQVGPVAGRALQRALVIFYLVRLGNLAASDFWLCITASADPCTISGHVCLCPACSAVFWVLGGVKGLAVVRRASLVQLWVSRADQISSGAPVGPVASRALQYAHVVIMQEWQR
jgi:hypothetical protein